MEGRVELQDITGRIGNTAGETETDYEIPTTSNIKEHEYMAISPIPTISHGNGDVPKYITMTEMAAFKRKIYIFCAVLLTLLVIVSVTSGVLIYNLVMQVEKAKIKSDDMQAQKEHLKSGSGEAKPTSTNAVQTKMVELESKLEAYKIDIANEIQMKFNRMQSLNLTLENVRVAVTTLSSDQQFIKKNQDDIQAQIEHLKSGSGEAKPTSTNAVQTKMVELESKLEAYKIDIKRIQDTKSAFSISFSFLTYDNTTNVLRFSSTILNIGGHFDNRTGIFTCEYRGTYVFMLNLHRYRGSGSGVRCFIRKDSNYIACASAPKYTEDSYNSGSGSAVVHLEPGDTVYVGKCDGTDNISSDTSFMGFLLQAD